MLVSLNTGDGVGWGVVGSAGTDGETAANESMVVDNNTPIENNVP